MQNFDNDIFNNICFMISKIFYEVDLNCFNYCVWICDSQNICIFSATLCTKIVA